MKTFVANRSGRRLNANYFRRDAAAVARWVKNRGYGTPPKEVAVIFVGASESRRLNRRYRRKDKPANVLAFDYNGSGEVIIAPDVVRRRARRKGLKFSSELRRLAVHGLLHIFGHHHERSGRQAAQFEKLEKNILKHLEIVSTTNF